MSCIFFTVLSHYKYNVKVIGVQVDAIERGEDRIEFKKTMNKKD